MSRCQFRSYHLLVGKLKVKLKRSGRYVASRVKYDTNSLKDPFISQQFCITTRNIYQALQDMQDPGDSIDASWDSLKKVWAEARARGNTWAKETTKQSLDIKTHHLKGHLEKIKGREP